MSNPLVKAFLFLKNYQLRDIFHKPELPVALRLMNYLTLLPIIIWPLAAFAGIFLFDNPKNMEQTYIAFILLLIYPFPLFIFTIISFEVYKTNKIVAYAFPIIINAALCILAYKIDLFN